MDTKAPKDVMSLPLAHNKHKHTLVELDIFAAKESEDYLNTLSCRQMEVLTAACNTLLPSIDISDATKEESLITFFGTSAAMAGYPQRVGSVISEGLKHPKQRLLRFTLWFLSTWIGTLIFCGRLCISNKFPYIQSYPQLSLKRREEIMVSWSLSYFFHLRLLFKALKTIGFIAFFTQVNEKNENPSWKAIGYPGPDPDFKNQTGPYKLLENESKNEKHDNHQDGCDQKGLYGPLCPGLIHLQYPLEIVVDKFEQHGFPIYLNSKRQCEHNSPRPSMVIKCDAVVIGSGSGGGVVAGVLAKAGYKVLVLEKGKYYARKNLTLLEGKTLDQMYLSNGFLATDDMSVLLLAGSTVGGGSAINWSASLKTPKHVTKEWCDQYDLELFQSELYKEALDVVCEKMGVQSETLNEGFNNAVLRKGCHELGYPVQNIPTNAPPDHYCGWCCLGCKDGKKKGTSETWLVDLVDSGNGVILPGCEAIEVLHKRKKGKDRKTASGVAFYFDNKGGKGRCIVESKVTIAACGALSTPALLKRSGLKNPNIGRNLHLHPVAMAWGYFPEEPSSEDAWPEKEKKSYEGGIMTAMSNIVDNSNGSGYGAVIQTPSLHPGYFSALTPWISGADMKTRMTKFSRTAHLFALARDKGSGTLKSQTAINYKMEQDDEENLQKGLEKVLRILAAAGAQEIGTQHCRGNTLNVKKASIHEFEKFVKEESSRPVSDLSTPICSAHQMGSCRMGTGKEHSAVNQKGETWEVEGLFVADTSVFPTALGVNPMVTVQAIAYCTAQSALDHLRRSKKNS